SPRPCPRDVTGRNHEFTFDTRVPRLAPWGREAASLEGGPPWPPGSRTGTARRVSGVRRLGAVGKSATFRGRRGGRPSTLPPFGPMGPILLPKRGRFLGGKRRSPRGTGHSEAVWQPQETIAQGSGGYSGLKAIAPTGPQGDSPGRVALGCPLAPRWGDRLFPRFRDNLF